MFMLVIHLQSYVNIPTQGHQGRYAYLFPHSITYMHDSMHNAMNAYMSDVGHWMYIWVCLLTETYRSQSFPIVQLQCKGLNKYDINVALEFTDSLVAIQYATNTTG